MDDQPTKFTEANALLHVQAEDDDAAREVLNDLMPGERRILLKAVYRMADLIEEMDE